ncbi:MAG: hypothetical protein ISR77_03995 [Pirellulaceae bacterium]|nr:hypothetical protein [Pirellulaceae bacterium]
MLSIITVTSLEDNMDLDGKVTLREAIYAANYDTSIDGSDPGSGADTIELDPDTVFYGKRIELDGSQLEISDDLTISGPGLNMLKIDAQGRSRVFYVNDDVEVSMSRLLITGGHVEGGNPWNDGGGGILNKGKLALSETRVDGSFAEGYGGGISNHGLLLVSDSAVQGNESRQGGGGIFNYSTGTLLLDNVSLWDNSAIVGGAISTWGLSLIVDSAITHNQATGNGGAIDGYSSESYIHGSVISENEAKSGGGFYGGGTWTITDCVFYKNVASGRAPLEGGGAIRSDFGTWTVDNVTLHENQSAYYGGGIYSGESTWMVTNATISRNSALLGGGIYGKGSWTISDSTISENSASGVGVWEQGRGAGIYAWDGSWALDGVTISRNLAMSAGGGIYSEHLWTRWTITGSTISNNTSLSAGGGIYGHSSDWTITDSTISDNWGSFTGGIHRYTGNWTLDNVTISGNQSDRTGGLDVSGPFFTITNSTISNNRGGQTGGVHSYSGLEMHNTIVADNYYGKIRNDISPWSRLQSNGSHNLIGVAPRSCGLVDGVNGNRVGDKNAPLDAKLAPLGDYGGTTQTHALLPDSPALDAGSNDVAHQAELGTDQRGFERISDGSGDGVAVVDMGAFEAGFAVSTFTDENDGNYGPNELSLREALALAAEIPGADVISLDILRSPRASMELSLGEFVVDSDVNIRGPGADLLTIDAAETGRVFQVAEGVTASIRGLTVTGGQAFAFLGPWFVPLPGGGIYNEGSLTLSEVAVTGNVATWSGGGIYNVGALTVRDSTISGNEAWEDGGGLSGSGTWLIANTTVSGNLANRHGGGISGAGGEWKINNSTIADNRADSDNNGTGLGGGIHVAQGTNAVTHSTIVAGNHRRRGLDDVRGVFHRASSYNLIGVINGSKGLDGKATRYGTAARPLDAMLAPLGDYGGPTQTHALRPGSPAVDRGYNRLALVCDQRGEARTSARHTDIGAFELQAHGYHLRSSVIEDRTVLGTHVGHRLTKTDPTPNGTSNKLSAADSISRSPGQTPEIGLERDLSRRVDKVFELEDAADWLMWGACNHLTNGA